MIDTIIGLSIVFGIMGTLLAIPFLLCRLTEIENLKEHWWNVMWSVLSGYKGYSLRLYLLFFVAGPTVLFTFITGVYEIESDKDVINLAAVILCTVIVLSNKVFLSLHRSNKLAKIVSSVYFIYVVFTSFQYYSEVVTSEFVISNWPIASVSWGLLLFAILVRHKTKELKSA